MTTILPSSTSLLRRQVRLIVSPPTTTLSESRAILSKLESSFGLVTTFINERHDPVLRGLLRSGPGRTATTTTPTTVSPPRPQSSFQTILAVFESPASQQSALRWGRLVVSTGGHLLPSAEELDPYNARGFHGRHHPPQRTFTCDIEEDNLGEDGTSIHCRLREQNPYYGGFRLDTLQVSYMDLVKSGVPLKDMADVMQTERTLFHDGTQHEEESQGNEELPATPSQGFYSKKSRLLDPQHNGGLMAAWKWAVKEKGEQRPGDGSNTAPERDDALNLGAEFKSYNQYME